MMKWLKWITGNPPSDHEERLEAWARMDDPRPGGRLAALLLLCISRRPDRAAWAAAELRRALAAIDPTAIRASDHNVRGDLLCGPGHVYRDRRWAEPEAVIEQLRRRLGDDAAVLSVLAMHPSGYVRYAAIQRLAATGDGSAELPVLIVRSYDWVEPVRRAAEEAALARITEANLPRVMECLGLLLRTRGWQRDGEVARRAFERMRSPAARPLRWTGLSSPDRMVRLACFEWLAEDDADRLDAVRAVFASNDPALRRAAAKASLRLPGEALPSIVPAMLGDWAARVRTHGVVLAGRLGPSAEPALLAAAVDENATVRLYARAELKGMGRVIDAPFYRAAVHDAPHSLGALAGLADLATADDAEVLERRLHASNPVRWRLTALRGYVRALRGGAVPLLLRLMASASPKVARAAAGELRPYPVPTMELAALYDAGEAHVRRNALRMLVRRSKWDGLGWAIRACADPHPRVAETGGVEVRRWITRFNRTYTPATGEQLARVGEALAAAAGSVPAADREWLAGLLPPDIQARVNEAVKAAMQGEEPR